MSYKDKFTGTGVAIITPFTSDLKIDFKALETHIVLYWAQPENQ